MIRSMTGFGAAEGRVGPFRVSVELRSVNHRFFNPTLKLPGTLARFEGEVREAMRRRITRGHVTMFARAERDDAGAAGAVIDEARFAGYVAQLRALQERHGLEGGIDLGTLLRMPDLFVSSEAEPDTASGEELVAIVDQAIDALTRMREEEGRRLAAYVEERVEVIESRLDRIAERAPARIVEQRDRLRAAVRELMDGVGADEQRIAQEIAILADRLDVSEELARFRSHLEACRQALGEGGRDGVGKRLGFLVQEMLREANTTGSKANDATILQGVVTIKEELERIREQVENLE